MQGSDKHLDWKHAAKGLAKWLGVGIAAILMVLLAALGILQTDIGKRKLASWLDHVATGKLGGRVRFIGLAGFVPFDLRLGQLLVMDSRGTWLVMDDLALRWSPATLFKGRLEVEELSASKIQLDRFPLPARRAERKGARFPRLPESLPQFSLRRLRVEQMEVGTSVLASGGSFHIAGKMRSTGSSNGLSGEFHLQRTDGPGDRASVRWTIGGSPPELTLDLRVREAESGLISALMGMKEKGPMTLALRGEGPLRSWKGKLDADVRGAGTLKASLGMAVDKTIKIVGEGTIRATPEFFPGSLLSFAPDREVRFACEAVYDPGATLSIRRMDLRSDRASLDLRGRIHAKTQAVSGTYILGVQDLSQLGGLLKLPIGGELHMEGQLAGNLPRPSTTMTVTLEKAKLQGIQAESVRSTMHLEPLSPSTSAAPGYHLEAEGRVDGLEATGKGPLPEKDVRWSLAAFASDDGTVQIQKLDVAGQRIRVHFQGALDPRDLTVQGESELAVPDLSPLAKMAGADLSGTLRLSTRLAGDLRRKTITVLVEGHLGGVGPQPDWVAPLIGPDVRVTARLGITDMRRLMLPNLSLDFAGATIRAGGSANLGDGKVEGEFKLAVSKLDDLSLPRGYPIGGSIEMAARLEGLISNPAVKIRAACKGFSYGDMRMDQLTVELEADGLPSKPAGRLHLHAEGQKGALDLKSGYQLAGKKLALRDLEIVAPETRVKGNLVVDLSNLAITGSINGRSNDLLAVTSLFGKRVSEKAHVRLGLIGSEAGQEAKPDFRRLLLFPI